MTSINELIAARDIPALKAYMKEYDLVVRDNKIVPRDDSVKEKIKSQATFWDQRQYVRKILLNALYGALLNEAMRFSDPRLGQSVTLTGRSIVRHMGATVNEAVTGLYDNVGDAVVYGDTDSVAGDTLVRTSVGNVPISELFERCSNKWDIKSKEYANDEKIKVYTGNGPGFETLRPILYVYRHKVSKRRFRVNTSCGKSVIVTEDHSIMVLDRENKLIEKKPCDLDVGDKVLVINTPTRTIGVDNEA